jgi:hypothetical protein
MLARGAFGALQRPNRSSLDGAGVQALAEDFAVIGSTARSGHADRSFRAMPITCSCQGDHPGREAAGCALGDAECDGWSGHCRSCAPPTDVAFPIRIASATEPRAGLNTTAIKGARSGVRDLLDGSSRPKGTGLKHAGSVPGERRRLVPSSERRALKCREGALMAARLSEPRHRERRPGINGTHRSSREPRAVTSSRSYEPTAPGPRVGLPKCRQIVPPPGICQLAAWNAHLKGPEKSVRAKADAEFVETLSVTR